MGIGQWARFDTDRIDKGINDGATFKTLGLLTRCVSYDLTKAIIEQGTGEPEVSLKTTLYSRSEECFMVVFLCYTGTRVFCCCVNVA